MTINMYIYTYLLTYLFVLFKFYLHLLGCKKRSALSKDIINVKPFDVDHHSGIWQGGLS